MSRADVNALTVFLVAVLVWLFVLTFNAESHENRIDDLERSPKVVTEVTR